MSTSETHVPQQCSLQWLRRFDQERTGWACGESAGSRSHDPGSKDRDCGCCVTSTNTTFRVDSDRERRAAHQPSRGVHGAETIGSEMAWLHAVGSGHRPGRAPSVVAPEGASVVAVLPSGTASRATPFCCGGRTTLRRCRSDPGHLRRVAVLQAGLQRHAAHWVGRGLPPALRRHVDHGNPAVVDRLDRRRFRPADGRRRGSDRPPWSSG